MDWMEILKLIAAIASGLAAAIPLAIQLVKYVKQAVKERNWNVVLQKVMKLMETAGINYDIDYDAIADMIDRLCDMSKIINPANPSAEKAEG